MISRRALHKLGVLGMNARNAAYISMYNPRRLFPLADNKLYTKEILESAGLNVPKLYGVIRGSREVRQLPALLATHNEFVVKPARGSGGEGIIVIAGRGENCFIRGNGEQIDLDSVRYHIQAILHGLYSLGGQGDQAMIEERIQFSSVFEQIISGGVPDIRIIVFLGVPVMAMLRLPTSASNGRANLHQGAVGAGIDISTGQTLQGVLKSGIVDRHPDTGHSIAGVAIPSWDTLLELAIRCQELVGLGYLGVDIVIDEGKGPMILEVNARPGLAVQIANQAGLRLRLDQVEKSVTRTMSIQERVDFAKERFAV